MSLENHYKTLTIYNFMPAYFGQPAKYVIQGTFLGLIQPPRSGNTNLGFFNQKDTANIAALLFCSNTQKFNAKDIIEDASGVKYKIYDDSNGIQSNGITGIEPRCGQHAEYKLQYFQEAI